MCLHYSEKNIREKVERQIFVSHSVYRVDDTDIPAITAWIIGKVIEPVIELYNDVVWPRSTHCTIKLIRIRKTDMTT